MSDSVFNLFQERFTERKVTLTNTIYEVQNEDIHRRFVPQLGPKTYQNMATRAANELPELDDALHMAALHGRGDLVKSLVGQGAKVDEGDNFGSTPLHVASQRGHLDVIEFLIGAGAQIDKHNKFGTTALLFASDKGHRDVVEYLVGKGAQVEESDNNDLTPLRIASQQGHLDVVAYLIGQGAKVEGDDNSRLTPLHVASKNGHLDVVKFLFDKGAKVDKPDKDGTTALLSASAEGNLDVVEYLVGKGAKVELVDNNGFTPLLVASANGHLDVVRYLVGQGAHVERGDNNGATPLLVASRMRHIDVVEFLVGQGAQVEGSDNNGFKPLHVASSYGHLNVVRYLVRQGAKVEGGDNNRVTPLITASGNGHLDVVKFLFDKGAKIDKPDKDGKTALLYASAACHLDVVQYLVGKGAQVEPVDNNGFTPLYVASHKGHVDVVKYLIGKGAQFDKPSEFGMTALHFASDAGHLDVVEYLVSQGSQIERGDNGGETPLHWASYRGHLDVVEYLVGQGAQFDEGDNDGVTPLYKASNYGHLDVVRYLVGQGAQRKEASPEEDDFSKALGDALAKRLIVTPPQDQDSLEPHGDTTVSRGLNHEEADDNNEGNDTQPTFLKHDSGSKRGDILFGGLSAPPEILARGLRARQAYAEAAQAGTKKVFRTRLMLVGQERVGKTSLKKILTGQRFDQSEAITDGVETTNACEICIEVAKAGENMWSIHKEGQGNEDTKEDDYIKALADDIAKRLIVTPPQNQESLEPRIHTSRSRGLNPEEAEDEYKQALADEIPNRPTVTSPQDQESFEPHSDTTLARGMNPVEAEEYAEAPKAKREDGSLPTQIASLVERMLKKQVHLKEKGTDSTDSGREERVSLSIWDFAGHDIYYTTHQVFLTWRAIYVIVFDLSRSLDSVVPPESRDKYYEMAKGGAKSELTCLEFINFWLCSIFAHAVAPSSVRNKDTSKTAQKSPPIFIVGTHRDSVQGNAKEKKEKIGSAFGKICESIMNRPFECHVVPKYYAIENSLEDKDEELVALRRHIAKVATEEPYMGEEIPLRWLLFEEALAADRINYMSLDQTKKLTQPFGMESEGELLTMLTFYHDLGYIVYFGGIEDQQSLLRDMVILNPQWLIDVFKQVITILDPAERDGIVSDAWTTLQKEGILEDRLIQHMWQGFLEQKEALVKLMAKFDLICEAPVELLQQEQLHGVDTEASNEAEKVVKKRYYVPSRLIPHCSPEEIAQITSSTDFYVDFRGFLPDGLFHRLMTRAVRWMVERDGEPVNLFYRHISLMVDEEHHALIEMLPPHEATIKVTVFQGAVADSDDDGDIHHPPAPSAVKEVRDFVRSTLDDLILHWSRRIEYDVCFLCPKCSKKKLLQDCFKRKSLKCGEHKIRTAAVKSKFGMIEEGVESGNQSPAMPRRSTCNESTVLCDLYFSDLAEQIGAEWTQLGIKLGLNQAAIDHITEDKQTAVDRRVAMLQLWKNRSSCSDKRKMVEELCKALSSCDRTDLAGDVKEAAGIS